MTRICDNNRFGLTNGTLQKMMFEIAFYKTFVIYVRYAIQYKKIYKRCCMNLKDETIKKIKELCFKG